MAYIFTKNGTLEKPKGISDSQFNSASYGTEFSYNPVDAPITFYYFTQSAARETSDYYKFKSLKNIINKRREIDDIFKFENLLNLDSTLISFNSLHLGSGIEKGTVELSFFYTGSVLNRATDSRQNGVLYDSSDKKIGFILYNEGFIFITGSENLSDQTPQWEGYGQTEPKWYFFGALSASDASDNFSCELDYKTKSVLPTTMVFVEANKNELNHSNNFTSIKSGSYVYSYTSSSFKESDKIEIKKTNKSPFISGSANFEKQTFITRIGLYDDYKKLIGTVSLANPIRKTENREFLFKIKLDI